MSMLRCPSFHSWRGKNFASYLKMVRLDKRPICFCNGVFDLLHPGHLFFLEEATRVDHMERTKLMVGVNSDESVRELKGWSRPFTSFKSRAQVLASLRIVDCVVGFHEITPEDLVQTVRPDVLVVGPDYGGRLPPWSKYCGRVVVANQANELRTTDIAKDVVTKMDLAKKHILGSYETRTFLGSSPAAASR